MSNLSELLDLHDDLEALFAEHQKKLLQLDFEGAYQKLEIYRSFLFKHIDDEETYLIPIYDTRGKIETAGKTKMFLDEHEKLRNHVELFLPETKSLQDERDPYEKLLWLIEREAFFKKLHDHHDIRETRFLYPELDRITDNDEKLKLLSQVTRNFYDE